MSDNKDKERDKLEKNGKAPPRISDPKLAQTVKFNERPRKKTIINIKKENLR